MAIKILLPFLTIYLYKASFSSFISTSHNRLNVVTDVKTHLSSFKPDNKEIVFQDKMEALKIEMRSHIAI